MSVSEQAEETSHAFSINRYSPIGHTKIPPKFQGTPEQVEAAYFRVASRIRYRLQLFNNLSFDQLDRLRIEVKMKEFAESDQKTQPRYACVDRPGFPERRWRAPERSGKFEVWGHGAQWEAARDSRRRARRLSRPGRKPFFEGLQAQQDAPVLTHQLVAKPAAKADQ